MLRHHSQSRHLPQIPVRDPSSLVLWFLVGLALVSLVFTTRETSDPAQTRAALSSTTSSSTSL